MKNSKSYLDFVWSVVEINTTHPYSLNKIYCFPGLSYRENISFSGFFHGLKNRNENKAAKRLYLSYFIPAYERIKELKCHETEIYLPLLKSGNFIACQNLYDFYDKIGWDRERKLYIKHF